MFHKKTSQKAAHIAASLLLLTLITTGEPVFAYPYADDDSDSDPAPTTTTTTEGGSPSGGRRGNNYIAPIVRLDERVIARKRRASSSSSQSSQQSSSAPACVPVTTSSTSTTWETVGTEGFSPNGVIGTVTALAPDNTPYMAYKDIKSKKISVMKYSGTDWVNVGNPGFSPGEVDDVALTIAPDGTPYVAYDDKANEDKAAVKKFNGNTWVDVGNTGFSTGETSNLMLATGFGKIMLGYTDYAHGGKMTVMQFVSSSNTWVAVGPAGFSANTVAYPSLAINASGTPYVAFGDSGNKNKASVMMYNGTKWAAVGALGFSSDRATYTSLALSPGGVPYVAYRENNMGYKATVMMFNGEKWQPVGTPLFSDSETRHTFIAVAPDGTPYVAYGDDSVSGNQRQTVKKFDGTAWVDVGTPGFSKGLSQYNTLAFASDGTLYVGYKDTTINSKVVVKKMKVTTTTSTTSCPSSRSSSSRSRAPSSSSASSVEASSSRSNPAILSGDIRCVQTDILNVRGDSRINAAIRFVASKGDRMTVLRVVHNDWAQVQTPDERGGYVWAQNLGACAAGNTPVSSASSSSIIRSSSSRIASSSSSASSSAITMCTNLAATARPVRSEPGMNAVSIIWRVAAHSQVECLGIVRGSLHVRGSDGREGYMSTSAMAIPPSFFSSGSDR